ncbi:hypothetical protein MASR2M117_24500 [Paludibacter sp.]
MYEQASEQLNNTIQNYKSNWLTDLTNIEMYCKELLSDIVQLENEKRQFVILSPENEIITEVIGLQTGKFILSGQTIAYISSNDTLIAECYVSPSDISYIMVNQAVSFRFDAYNYNEWGMLQGTVYQIIHDISSINNQPVFRVQCKLNQTKLQLPNGYKRNIQKGLSFTAHFYLNRRSLWQLLFDDVDNWLNPKLHTKKG